MKRINVIKYLAIGILIYIFINIPQTSAVIGPMRYRSENESTHWDADLLTADFIKSLYNITAQHTLIAKNISISNSTDFFLFVTSSGRVGIGTASPDTALDIVGDITMLGNTLNLGDVSAVTDTEINFYGSTNNGSITFDESKDKFIIGEDFQLDGQVGIGVSPSVYRAINAKVEVDGVKVTVFRGLGSLVSTDLAYISYINGISFASQFKPPTVLDQDTTIVNMKGITITPSVSLYPTETKSLTVNSMIAYSSTPTLLDGGHVNVSDFIGFSSALTIYQLWGTTNVDVARMFRAKNPSFFWDPATIGELYAYYDEGMTSGVTNWGFYGLSAQNYFAGNVGIGTTDINATFHVLGDVKIEGGDLNISEGGATIDENITAENVWLPTFCFAHTNVTMPVVSAGVWINITFDEEASFCTHLTHDHSSGTLNDTFIIQDDGVYEISYVAAYQDSAASPTGHIVTRLIRNGTEIHGSLLECDTKKQSSDKIVTLPPIYVSLTAGDQISLQFTSDDTTVSLTTDFSYGTHRDTGLLSLRRIG